ncbi:hypothetical protein HAX54_040649 [Datura stramonium]|uniref:Uncharacterized protein n=1 Tax=Datura stramonium TaxID=4076 RepID=A0ABS8VRP8_DATST|nr:hypothetical protein [Datura stramonium]
MIEDREKGRIVPGYLLWLHKPSLFGKNPEGSEKRKWDKELEIRAKVRQVHLEVENEFLARLNEQQIKNEARITQTWPEVERDYQSSLQVMEEYLRRVKQNYNQLEEELGAEVELA